jgi:acetyltransferase-like isoleucine patch superfamily enzyme
MIAAGNHNFSRIDVPIMDQGNTAKGIRIEDDVWIGANSVILDGVTIRHGAIVAAGTVVTNDVETFSVVAGVPAQKKRVRQNP